MDELINPPHRRDRLHAEFPAYLLYSRFLVDAGEGAGVDALDGVLDYRRPDPFPQVGELLLFHALRLGGDLREAHCFGLQPRPLDVGVVEHV